MENSINEVFKNIPELKSIYNKAQGINRMRAAAAQEQDHELRADMLESCLKRLDGAYGEGVLLVAGKNDELFNKAIENFDIMEKTANEYKAALLEERKQNRESFDNLCAAFTVNPRSAFEVILRFIERDEKCKCPDGFENWQWGLHFPLIARLRMAWRLIFGRKDILESNMTAQK